MVRGSTRKLNQYQPAPERPPGPDPRELLRMLEHLELGDVVTVTRIDRLARSTFDLFSIVKRMWTPRRVPILGGTVGRHGHQHRALDAGGTRRPCRC
jgi:hypothetical protein